MKRLILTLLATLLTALLLSAPADAATSKASKAKVVCFKKTVKTKSGRKVRKKVCRARTRTKKPTAAPQTPAPTTPDFETGPGPSPNSVSGPGPSPNSVSGPGPSPKPPTPACVPEDSEWLTVTALDVNARFTLRLSRTCLRAGRTVVQYQNQDAQDHDLWVEGTAPAVAKRELVASVAPATLEQAETTLSPGEWRLFCSIPGHGTMSRTVTVVP